MLNLWFACISYHIIIVNVSDAVQESVIFFLNAVLIDV